MNNNRTISFALGDERYPKFKVLPNFVKLLPKIIKVLPKNNYCVTKSLAILKLLPNYTPLLQEL